MLSCQFSNFSEVVVTLLLSETGETDGGLTTLSVLLGKLHSDFLKDFPIVALKSGVKGAITVDDNEAEFLIILQEALQRGGIEPVTTVIEGLINGSEGLKIVVDLFLSLAIVHQNDTAENNQAILRGVLVKLDLGAC
jgi:hypothetical protein